MLPVPRGPWPVQSSKLKDLFGSVGVWEQDDIRCGDKEDSVRTLDLLVPFHAVPMGKVGKVAISSS